MLLLNQSEIENKLNRLALEIYERNQNETAIYIGGINNKGYLMAQKICSKLQDLTPLKCEIFNIKLNPAEPLSEIHYKDFEIQALSEQCVLIIDDVSNTGRTMQYAIKPILNVLPKSVQTLVLVERAHKLFPIHTDFIGLQLATTIHQNIEVNIDQNQIQSVTLHA